MAQELIRYDAMCRAIADAYEVDEVKDLRDKALAIEIYARQARNTEAERQACEIRLRAERKCGQFRGPQLTCPHGRYWASCWCRAPARLPPKASSRGRQHRHCTLKPTSVQT